MESVAVLTSDPQQHRPTVLVVEAEFLVRWRTAEFLRDAGFRVIEAVCAGDAIAVFSCTARVDVVLSEVDTPGDVNGHALARWLAKYHPSVCMLLSSRREDSRSLLASGPTRGFVAKPYLKDDLMRRLKQMLPHADAAPRRGQAEFRSSASPAAPSDR